MLSFIFTNYKNNRGQGGFIANVCALAMYVSAYAKMAAARSDWLHPLAVARIGGLHSSNLYITSLHAPTSFRPSPCNQGGSNLGERRYHSMNKRHSCETASSSPEIREHVGRMMYKGQMLLEQ